nr:hypothetical protein [Tanacetum cinerariifolium]
MDTESDENYDDDEDLDVEKKFNEFDDEIENIDIECEFKIKDFKRKEICTPIVGKKKLNNRSNFLPVFSMVPQKASVQKDNRDDMWATFPTQEEVMNYGKKIVGYRSPFRAVPPVVMFKSFRIGEQNERHMDRRGKDDRWFEAITTKIRMEMIIGGCLLKQLHQKFSMHTMDKLEHANKDAKR